MKKVSIILFMMAVLLASTADASLTYGADYYQTNIRSLGKGLGNNDPLYLFISEADTILSSVSAGTYYSFTPSAAPATPAEGMLYYDATSDNLIYYNGSGAWKTLGISASGTLDEAYNSGNGITVDGSAVTLTVTDAANNAALLVVQNDATNDPDAMNITSAADAATAVGLQIDCTAGFDVQGTGDSWNISIAGVFNGESLTGLTNGQAIVFDTNEEIQFGDSEDIAFGFGTSNTLTLSSDTSVDTIEFGAVDAFTGVGAITFDAGSAGVITLASDGAADDLTLALTGANDSSIFLNSAGTAADAILLSSSAGGITVTATGAASGDFVVTTVDDVSITATDDITLNGGSAGSIINIGTNTHGDVIHIGDNDTTADAITIGSAKDTTIVAGISTTIGSTGTTSATTIQSGTGDITLSSGDDIFLSTNTGTGDVISLINTAGTNASSLILRSTAGGVDIDAAAALDVDIAGGQVNLVSKDNAASAIALTANVGTSETIVVTNTKGTAAGAIALTATAGGVAINGGSGGDVAVTSTGKSVIVTATEAAADAIALVATTGAGGITATSGSGGINLNASVNQPVNIGSGTSTGTVTIGGAAAQAITIGNGAAAKTVTLGSSTTTSTTNILSGSGGINLTGAVVRTGQQYIQTIGYCKVATTAGWVVPAAADAAHLVTLPASQTASTLVIPITIPLKVGCTITAWTLNGQIDSAGNTATLDAKLYKHTEVSTGFTNAAVGSGMTQLSKTGDYKVVDGESGLTEVVAADETFYLLLTGTTAATTDIEIAGITVTISEV